MLIVLSISVGRVGRIKVNLPRHREDGGGGEEVEREWISFWV